MLPPGRLFLTVSESVLEPQSITEEEKVPDPTSFQSWYSPF